MKLESLKGCQLAIGRYPRFNYDASGGGGDAIRIINKEANVEFFKFNPNTFSIPAINWKTTKILGLPIPPGLEISMSLIKLEGTIEERTGKVSLSFDSRFILSIFSLIKFPELVVQTSLTSKAIQSKFNSFRGIPLQSNGHCRLVGIAIIPKTGNYLLDFFLDLPNEALAILKCKIQYN